MVEGCGCGGAEPAQNIVPFDVLQARDFLSDVCHRVPYQACPNRQETLVGFFLDGPELDEFVFLHDVLLHELEDVEEWRLPYSPEKSRYKSQPWFPERCRYRISTKFVSYVPEHTEDMDHRDVVCYQSGPLVHVRNMGLNVWVPVYSGATLSDLHDLTNCPIKVFTQVLTDWGIPVPLLDAQDHQHARATG